MWIAVHAVLFAISKLISGSESMIAKLATIPLNLLLHASGAIMAFTALVWIGERVKWENSKVFGVLSSSSMIIYLLHQQIIYFSIYLLNGLINPYLNSIINFVISLSLSLAISVILLRFKTTRFLMGEK